MAAAPDLSRYNLDPRFRHALPTAVRRYLDELARPPKSGRKAATQTTGVKVCDDIEACCPRCGDARHVVHALDAGRIARVQCKGCGAQHAYTAPAGRRPRAIRLAASAAGL